MNFVTLIVNLLRSSSVILIIAAIVSTVKKAVHWMLDTPVKA